MVSFVAAYTIVWLAVVFYVGWLERRQRQLRRTLEALRSSRPAADAPTPRAQRTRAA